MAQYKNQIILVSLALLSACAPRWEKPGATPAQLQSDQTYCTAGALWRYPPQMHDVLVSPGFETPGHSECSTYSDGSGRSVTRCVWVPGTFSPPLWSSFDANTQARARDVAICMQGKGWSLQK